VRESRGDQSVHESQDDQSVRESRGDQSVRECLELSYEKRVLDLNIIMSI